VRTMRLKVKREAYPWLEAAAIEVNRVWNWSAEYTQSRMRNGLSAPSPFDFSYLAKGWAVGFQRINCDTIHAVMANYAQKRRAAKRQKLKWRVSGGSRRSLGWVPLKRASLRKQGNAFRFCGKSFRVFEADRISAWRSGCFAQDACGDWWLCLPVETAISDIPAPSDAVGVDLGLKETAVTSDGDRLESGHYRRFEARIAQAQRRGHKRQAKLLHRRAKRCRADGMHKFSTALVQKYQRIFVGDVSSSKLVKTRMAKSVLDAGWGMLKAQLTYKGENAGRCVEIVDERSTSVTCSACGSLSGPRGVNGLAVRSWVCADCGESHDRDCNAALNILFRGEASPSMRERRSAHECRRHDVIHGGAQ
jgi:putative transposase